MPESPGALAAPPAAPLPAPSTKERREERFREYRSSRELLRQLVRRDLRIQHRGTLLGNVWSLLMPILTVGVYTFVFTVIMPASPVREGAGNVPFPVYLFVGLVMWNLLQNSILGGTGSVLGAGYLLSKVYFRREILPLASVMSALVTFCWEFAVAFVSVVIFVRPPDWRIVYLPIMVLVTLLVAFGFGLLLSTAAVFFRDVQHFIGIFMQIWFWGSPVIYSITILHGRNTLLKLLQLNPMTGVLVSVRNVLLDHTNPDWKLLAWGTLVGVVMIAIGYTVFRRNERLFAEMI
ncbi:MAG TPA: ABC transporter permease [Candidatus Limnocylindrales bacterium]